MTDFHEETMSRSQARQIERLARVLCDEGWYLAGGTALAICLGHRRSVDLDWFAPALEDPLALAARIRDAGLAMEVRNIAKGTLEGTIGGVRVSFMEYRYPLLKNATHIASFRASLAAIHANLVSRSHPTSCMGWPGSRMRSASGCPGCYSVGRGR